MRPFFMSSDGGLKRANSPISSAHLRMGGARGGAASLGERVRAMATGKPRFAKVPAEKRAFARQLRNEMTDAERQLWRALRERIHPIGYKFRRQFVIPPYIADFCCLRARLVVEVDGEQHGFVSGRQHDAERDAFLAEHGFRVLRFSNRDVTTSLFDVVETIYHALLRGGDVEPEF